MQGGEGREKKGTRKDLGGMEQKENEEEDG